METQYFKEYSPALGREMECKLYGHAGRPMLFIPCQDGRFFDFENYHMAGTLAPWIDSGQVMVLSIDTMDKESWSDKDGRPLLAHPPLRAVAGLHRERGRPHAAAHRPGEKRLGRPAGHHPLWVQPGGHPRPQPLPAPPRPL